VSEGREQTTRMVEVVFPHLLNHQGTLFGSQALRMMDTAAFVAATRRARRTMVTVGVEEVSYQAPVRQGEIVEIAAEVSRVGRSSVTVEVQMYAEEYQATRDVAPVAAGSPLWPSMPTADRCPSTTDSRLPPNERRYRLRRIDSPQPGSGNPVGIRS
jgi:acyl-coenzyme A thioesterase PaaI-like protein